MNKLIFVGPIHIGNTPSAGDSMKNQMFLTRFGQVYERVIPIDTAGWKRRPWVLLNILFKIANNRKAKVIISANPGSADRLISIIKRFHFSNDIFYWVIGGSFHKMISEGRFKIGNYSFLKGVFVQGQTMVESLNKSGLNNVVYVPNSKLINYQGGKEKRRDGKAHFVFLSRVEEYKGCTDIIKSVELLNNEGYGDKFDVTFYGHPSRDSQYLINFSEKVKCLSNVEYKGVLNLLDDSNYDILSSYDCMLFPTYWEGEGFPGVVIDAYIASLPIIASDWNLNKDVIKEGQTGWIIPPHDVSALSDKMRYVINNHETVKEIAINCRKKAAQYDSRVVLSEENLKKLGLIVC